MSYEIIYKKQFIKVQKDNKTQFAPIILAGSNNCFETSYNSGKERRSRSWWNFEYATNYKGFATLEEFIANAKAFRQEKIDQNKESNAENDAKGRSEWNDTYSDKAFGYWVSMAIGGRSTVNTTYGEYEGLFKTGCKQALTVEELKERSVSVYVKSGYASTEEMEKVGKKTFSILVATSDELVKVYEEQKEYLKDTKFSTIIEISASEWAIKNIERERKIARNNVKRVKVPTEFDSFFVVKDKEEGNYIIKCTRNGYQYSYYGRRMAKRFVKENEAKRYANKLSLKYNSKKTFVVEKIKEKVTIAV